jgi:hypothetical protein
LSSIASDYDCHSRHAAIVRACDHDVFSSNPDFLFHLFTHTFFAIHGYSFFKRLPIHLDSFFSSLLQHTFSLHIANLSTP